MKQPLLTLALLLLGALYAQAQDAPNAPSPPPEEGDFFLVEEMPRFPGCETINGDNAAKKRCADQKMLEFIYGHVNYPLLAQENNVEGMAVVSFTVTAKGKIKNVEVLRDPGSGLGDEAKRVVELMKKLPKRWTPGRSRGKPVEVRYNLPVRFKLEAPTKSEEEKSNDD